MRRLPGSKRCAARAAGVALAALAALAALLDAPSAFAQETLLPNSSWGGAPVFSTWHFSTPIAQSAGAVSDVQQFAVPLRVRTVLGGRWTLDVSGAAAASTVTLQGGGTNGAHPTMSGSTSLTLNGLTDVRVRVSGSLADDRILVTGGLNLPVGTTGLDADQTSALQAVGAPALHMPVGALGMGPGVTLGIVGARESGPWALALGASLEERTEYTPIELALASGTSLTKVSPGTALHLTFGADRAVGEHRLGLLLVADAYAKDRVTVGLGGGGTASSDYTLGPQVSAIGSLDLSAPGWRDANGSVALRYRSAFSDASGATVSGSSGTYLEAAVSGVRGAATGRGIILGLDARYHSGLSFTSALVGAAATAAGVTVGVELPSTAMTTRLALHGQFGHFSTGTSSSNGIGLALVCAIAARREAR
ncbi:MAG: hypothetical protein ACHQQR_04515 [Gemmatimonadales bacterium]|jgi:hypothetical protein